MKQIRTTKFLRETARDMERMNEKKIPKDVVRGEGELLVNMWGNLASALEERIGAEEMTRWFRGVELLDLEPGVLGVVVQCETHKMWIEVNHENDLRNVVFEWMSDVNEVVLISREKREDVSGVLVADVGAVRREVKPATLEQYAKVVKRAGLNGRFLFENFVVGPSNEFAQAASLALAKGMGGGYNPLFVHGGPGMGKTHLLHAIGQEYLRNHPQAKVAYVTSETFSNEFIEGVRNGRLATSESYQKTRNRYRSLDLLLIDDVQFLAGKGKTQEEFFHTFNALLDGQKMVVLSCDRPASEIQQLDPRMVSRFECGLTVEVLPPCVETRLGILRRKAAERKVRLRPEILELIAERISSNVRRLEGALVRVATLTSLAGDDVKVEQIEGMLRDLFSQERGRTLTVDMVQQRVAEHFALQVRDLTGPRRPANLVLPRQIAMYLSRRLTSDSLHQIGDAFGGRDHGTVMHACRKITKEIEVGRELREMVVQLEVGLRR